MSSAAEESRVREHRDCFLAGEPAAWVGWDPEPISIDELLPAWKRALDRRGTPGSPATVQFYTHFAYCRMHCRFCQYWHLVPKREDQYDSYVAHLVETLGRYRKALGRVDVTNAYFGGGTPTALSARQLRRFLEAFATTIRVRSEFACEAHPSTIDREKLELLARAGVNRISMGLQSTDPAVLKKVTRTNEALPKITEMVRHAQRLSMFVNIDLILGLPLQTPASTLHDLRELTHVAPDMITVYRYQPVAKLPDVPDPTLHLRNVLRPGVLASLLRAGYLPAAPIRDDSYSAIFLRPSSRVVRYTIRYFSTFMRSRLSSADFGLAYYTDLEVSDAHLLGIGPGSISHLYGHSWYREVSALPTQNGPLTPKYWGTRLTPEEECRSSLLCKLARHEPVALKTLQRRSERSPHAVADPSLQQALRDGTLRLRADRLRVAPGTDESLRQLLIGLLPRAPRIGATPGRKEAIEEFRHSPDVFADLMEAARGCDADTSSPALAPANANTNGNKDISDAQRADYIREWCAVTKLSVGSQIGEAIIERIDAGMIHLRVDPVPAATILVMVGPVASEPSFCRSSRFSFSYKPHAKGPPTLAEQRAIQALCERTLEAESCLPDTVQQV